VKRISPTTRASLVALGVERDAPVRALTSVVDRPKRERDRVDDPTNRRAVGHAVALDLVDERLAALRTLELDEAVALVGDPERLGHHVGLRGTGHALRDQGHGSPHSW
jgi:hypothetical protein